MEEFGCDDLFSVLDGKETKSKLPKVQDLDKKKAETRKITNDILGIAQVDNDHEDGENVQPDNSGLKRGAGDAELEPPPDGTISDAAKKMKLEEEIEKETLFDISRVETRLIHESESCIHEAIVPVDFVWEDLKPLTTKPAKDYAFILDPFQQEALKCIQNDRSVLVSAHTSAGKTVVAEYAIAQSLLNKQRVIYTTPIKALSNQKFREMTEEFGDVGLMTGDVTISPTASCLIMTTEILRSMLYRGSEVLREVGWVIFDEIHYMRDKERGVVWEESIILLPDSVHFVFLSATIPNAKQYAEWVCQLHSSPCHVVYTEYRPTPLQHYIFPDGGNGIFLVVDEKRQFRNDNFEKAMAFLQEEGASGGKGKGKKGGFKQGKSDIFSIVKMIMERSLQPVIVFAFSKRDCESHALAMSKLDFNTAEEKKLVREVFENATDVLSDDDKMLPQVSKVLPMLERGIGIHHGGLLPILKEVIEILFQEGLIKALFATETFAMGLNMPARTVVFSSCKKFDGKDTRYITSGEYIQMSGRAGRRGIDDRGIVILCVSTKMEPAISKDLIQGTANPLNSAFRLTYHMVLNLLRVEDVNPEFMLERSFYQYQNTSSIPFLMNKLQIAEVEHAAIDIPNEESARTYFNLKQQLAKLQKQLLSFIHKPRYILPFLQPGRLIKVQHNKDSWGWGIVVNFQKKGKQAGATDPLYVVEGLFNCCSPIQPSVPPKPAPEGNKGEWQVVPVMLHLVTDISAVRLYLPKNLVPLENRESVGKSLREVEKRFPDGVPLLDPVEDMKIKDQEFEDIVRRIETLEHRLYKHPVHEEENITEVQELCDKKNQLAIKCKDTKQELRDARTVLQLDELKCRKRVLRRLGYCSASDVIETKGRVACEISTGQELALAELIFNGAFNDLTPPVIAALLSCFVFDENVKEAAELTDENLKAPFRQVQEVARKIAQVENECKLDTDVDEYVDKFKWELMSVVHAWANGAKFYDICKMTPVFEGSIIRVMRRLEELLRQMILAAKAIGNNELERKFGEASTAIKRDIVFAASLYL